MRSRGGWVVEGPLAESPAEESGILPGQRLIEIGGYPADLLSPLEEPEPANRDIRSPTPPPPLPDKSPHLTLPRLRTSPEALLPPTNHSELSPCTTPIPLHTGTLLYLCKPVSPDSLPVWISCDATLHHSHIVLTWFSALGNPSTTLVQLSQCADVRSLAVDDLDPAEGSMLPEDPNFREPKVFELLFEGRASFTFCAGRLRVRADAFSHAWSSEYYFIRGREDAERFLRARGRTCGAGEKDCAHD